MSTPARTLPFRSRPRVGPFHRRALGVALGLDVALTATACSGGTSETADGSTATTATTAASEAGALTASTAGATATTTAPGSGATGATDAAGAGSAPTTAADASTATTAAPPTTAAPAVPATTTPSGSADAGSTTALPPAAIGVPVNPPLNQARQPIVLDETALLACANTQFAWVALQQSDVAGARTELGRAAQRALVSAVPEVASSGTQLQQVAAGGDAAPVVDSFLALCKSRGFEY